MTPQNKTPSLQDILKRRQRSDFVGREEQISLFRQNLALPLDDDRRHFIVSVFGQGGVGKTWLVRRFRHLAETNEAITAWTDEAEDDVPGVMGRIAEHFEDQGYALETFSERYRKYREKRQELEADPQAPQGLPAFVGRTLAKTGIRLARRTPIGGVAFDFVDEEAFATQMGEWADYVRRRLTNKDEVRLVLEPVQVLTPLFLKDLREFAEKRAVALFFDTYERTGEFLDAWLREMLEGRHGEAPANIVLAIAGRHELDKDQWSPFEGLICRLPLEPFTEEEARDYLTRKGITNEKVVEVILRLSGRLPLLVATLAAESPEDPEEVGDPSGEAVERFLKWVDDPKQRRVALGAALPRHLNRDVLAILVGEAEADGLFEWLKEVPFVEERAGGWIYHPVVREPMLRHKRHESPRGWADLHGRLADYYEKRRDSLELDDEAGRRDATWQGYALEVLYHRLCQAPHGHLSYALEGFIAALKARRAFARRWAETLHQAGEDAGTVEVQRWGERLVEGLNAYDEGCYEAAAEMFTALLDQANLETRWCAAALDWRGYLRHLAGRYEEALTDLGAAVQLAPEEAEYWADRSWTYRQMERYDEALADFNRAIELDPDLDWAIADRGETCRLIERYDEALADFNRAIELNPDYARAIADRGETYRLLERYDEALVDFNRTIELNPDYAWTIVGRGETYWLLERYDEALADFNRAINLDPYYVWAIASRGQAYSALERYEKALADFNRAIELDPDLDWAIADRGWTYRLMERYDEALADFNRAIELDPDLAWAIASRGETYRLMKQYNEALADFNRAIELDPDSSWYLFDRGVTYQTLGQTDKAEADLTAAIQHAGREYEENPQNWRNTLNLALYHLAAGEAEPAERLYWEALSGEALLHHVREAIRDLDDLLALFPNHDQARAMRDLLQAHLEEAEH